MRVGEKKLVQNQWFNKIWCTQTLVSKHHSQLKCTRFLGDGTGKVQDTLEHLVMEGKKGFKKNELFSEGHRTLYKVTPMGQIRIQFKDQNK